MCSSSLSLSQTYVSATGRYLQGLPVGVNANTGIKSTSSCLWNFRHTLMGQLLGDPHFAPNSLVDRLLADIRKTWFQPILKSEKNNASVNYSQLFLHLIAPPPKRKELVGHNELSTIVSCLHVKRRCGHHVSNRYTPEVRGTAMGISLKTY